MSSHHLDVYSTAHVDSFHPSPTGELTSLPVADGPAVSPIESGSALASMGSFDPTSEEDWNNLVRDVVAIANSGGGRLIVALSPDGRTLNQWQLVRRISERSCYTFDKLRVIPGGHAAQPAASIVIRPAIFPLGLVESASDGTTRTIFYVRHGDRSEPATTADMQGFVERSVTRLRRRWLRRIRRAMTSPSMLATSPPTRRADSANLQPVRIVTDPNAPALQPQDVDRLYPWRQKDLVRELNARLGRRMLNSYDIQAIRRQHQLDERPDFIFNLPGAGRRYSPAVADWIIEQLAADPGFFEHARAADHELMRLRRQKPK
jgi:hypothetical protein